MRTLGRVLLGAAACAAMAWAAMPGAAAAKGSSCDPSVLRATPRETSIDALRSAVGTRRKGASGLTSRVYVLQGDLVGMWAAGRATALILAQPGDPVHTVTVRFDTTACRKSKRTAKLRAAMRRAHEA